MINYPDTPYVGQLYVTANASWQWDGEKWNAATQGAYILTTGGTITGNFTVLGNTSLNTVTATAPPLNDSSSSVPTTSWVNGWVSSRNFATQTWVQQQGYITASAVNGVFLPLTGGNLSGNLTFSGAGSGHNSSSAQAIFTPNRISLRVSPGDQVNAGAIDYRQFDGSALSIVGAGTVGGSRHIRLFDNVTVDNGLYVTGIANCAQINARDGIYFKDRTNWSLEWCLYAYGGTGRLWNNSQSDILTINYSNGYVTIQKRLFVAPNFQIFDDGNAHLEAPYPIWLNQYSGAAIYLQGDTYIASGRHLLIQGGWCLQNNNQWYGARDTGGGWRGVALVANNNHLYFGGQDLTTHYRGAGIIYYECTDHHRFNGSIVLGYGGAYHGVYNWGGLCNILQLDGNNNLVLFASGGGYVWFPTDIRTGAWIYTNGQVRAIGQIWTNDDVVLGGGGGGYLYGRDTAWNTFELIAIPWDNNVYISDGARGIQLRGDTHVTTLLTVNRGIRYWNGGHEIVLWWDEANLQGYVDGTWIGTLNNNCDERFKTNIEPSTRDALAAVNALQLYSYTRKHDKRDEAVGLIAQQIAEVIPEAVIGSPIHRDRNSEKFYAPDVGVLIAYMARSIQQLDAKIVAMEEEIRSLRPN